MSIGAFSPLSSQMRQNRTANFAWLIPVTALPIMRQNCTRGKTVPHRALIISTSRNVAAKFLHHSAMSSSGANLIFGNGAFCRMTKEEKSLLLVAAFLLCSVFSIIVVGVAITNDRRVFPLHLSNPKVCYAQKKSKDSPFLVFPCSLLPSCFCKKKGRGRL